ncbi:MAG: AAA family ATPase [Alphaproteobacteria bacterium]|nr:AAA family ATPase [Alphaproteobacteria bacterium]
MKRYRIKVINADCEAWVEVYGDEPTLVVNSQGGVRDRRPGLARILEALALRELPVREICYHPERKDPVAIEGLPLAPEDVLKAPRIAVRDLHLLLGRVEGANQGSRIRFFFDGVSAPQLEQVLQDLAVEPAEPDPEPRPPAQDIDGTTLVDHVHAWLRADGFAFTREQVADLYLSLRTKPFVLLAGISGTGKSALARRFAQACGFPAPLVPVRPDWSDPAELLGYRDLEGRFVPGRLLPLLVEAAEQPERPYFLVLDEMNLARVEHYFADLLSVMETRKLDGGAVVADVIPLELEADTPLRCDEALAARIRGHLVDGGLPLPPNLCVIGTVNMDESTHPFSKKVLDRAMTLEFVEVDLDVVPAPEAHAEPLSVHASALSAPVLSLSQVYAGREARFDPAIQLLVQLNLHLAEASMQVAYRTRDEVCLFLHHSAEQGLLAPEVALDLAVHHKVLPRIQGGEEVRELLAAMRGVLADAGLTRCVKKVVEMQRRLDRAGFTAFWA